jgi:hypothetical protein
MANTLTFRLMFDKIEKKQKVLHGLLLSKSYKYTTISNNFMAGYRRMKVSLISLEIPEVLIAIVGDYY